MKKARVLVTMDCPRECSYCCNNYEEIMDTAEVVKDFRHIDNFDEVMITGGEPMLNPTHTTMMIGQARMVNPKAKIYLYTALYHESLRDIVEYIDGIHYTLHSPCNRNDLIDLKMFQERVARLHYKEKSFRLYIHNLVASEVTIIPQIWTRVEVKAWLSEKECKLPEGEELFIIKD